VQERFETIDAALIEDGTVLRILLNRPKGNVLSMRMMGEISEALGRHQDERHLRLVLLRGAGGHFSFGASIDEHQRSEAPAMLRTFHALVRAVAGCPVPIAALVEGRCLGGAFELVLCCHFVFARATARFGCPEIRLGVFPPVFAVAGALRLGGALAERLLLTGGELDAATADRAGFLTSTLDESADAEQAVLAWYRANLRPLSAFALRQAVGAGRRGSGLLERLAAPLDAAEHQYVTAVLESRDGNEGIDAFLARRAPVWQDA
jgi:cyclohexa-1,5-dienecarbonyl-CoA hydratase